MKQNVTYYLSDGHPTWASATTIALTAKTDTGARRQANKIEKEHTFSRKPKLFFYRRSDGCWGEISR